MPGPRAGEMQVEIVDNGGGIPPALLPKIFDPFFTSKEIGEGTGLGLSISRTIVTRHKGRMDVENCPGTGVTFTVVLLTVEALAND
jgi:two-component system NtrC family sensor kinase